VGLDELPQCLKLTLASQKPIEIEWQLGRERGSRGGRGERFNPGWTCEEAHVLKLGAAQIQSCLFVKGPILVAGRKKRAFDQRRRLFELFCCIQLIEGGDIAPNGFGVEAEAPGDRGVEDTPGDHPPGLHDLPKLRERNSEPVGNRLFIVFLWPQKKLEFGTRDLSS